MNNILNLNKFRKKKNRDDAEIQANVNRQKFGRTKEQKKKDDIDAKKASVHLDAHKIEDDQR